MNIPFALLKSPVLRGYLRQRGHVAAVTCGTIASLWIGMSTASAQNGNSWAAQNPTGFAASRDPGRSTGQPMQPSRSGPVTATRANFTQEPGDGRNAGDVAGAMPTVEPKVSKSETPACSENQLLLSLLMQEQVLLKTFGPDHPDVRAVRARIEAVRQFMTAPAAAAQAVQATGSAVAKAPGKGSMPACEKNSATLVVEAMPGTGTPRSSNSPTAVPPPMVSAPADANASSLLQNAGGPLFLVAAFLVQLGILWLALRRYVTRLVNQTRHESRPGTAAPWLPVQDRTAHAEIMQQRLRVDAAEENGRPYSHEGGDNLPALSARRKGSSKQPEATSVRQGPEERRRTRKPPVVPGV